MFYGIVSRGADKQFLTAPVKSAVDKYQLVPEFLKVKKKKHILCHVKKTYFVSCMYIDIHCPRGTIFRIKEGIHDEIINSLGWSSTRAERSFSSVGVCHWGRVSWLCIHVLR